MAMPPVLPPQIRKRKRRRSILVRFFGFVLASTFLVALAGSTAALIVLWHFSKDLPDYEVLANYEPPVMTRVHAGDGSLIAEFARERRIFVPLNTIPPLLRGAFLSAEDKNFYSHQGLDMQALARAVYNNFVLHKGLSGASTITQQVAKNFLLTNERTYERKIKEAILSIRIERAYSKDTILELYLNEIYLGIGSYGVAAASLNYFNKELHELTPAEAAYLAALPKAPNNYHPFKKTKEAIERRNWVLGQMRDNGYITAEQHDEAVKSPLGVNLRPVGAHLFAAEFFAEDIRRTLVEQFGEDKLYGGGYSVRSTLDPKLQVYAKKVLVDGLVSYDRQQGWRGVADKMDISGDWGAALANRTVWSDIDPWRVAVVLSISDQGAAIGIRPGKLPNGDVEETRIQGLIPPEKAKWAMKSTKKGMAGLLSPGDVIYVSPVGGAEGQWELQQPPEIEGGIVVMDPHTGRVLALVGGFSFDQGQFDRVTQAKRQPGSSFKPFVYTTALDNGYTPSTVILDAPITIDQGPGQEVWKPENYSGKFYGPSTLRTGIEFSRNLMTVRLAQDVGMPLVSEYARRFGIYDNLMPVLSMALGAGETTLLKMATGYCILANGGHKVYPTLIDRIQDRRGQTIWRHDTRECHGCQAKKPGEEPELPDDRKQIIDPHTAYQITSMLEGVVQRGTATVLQEVGKPVAGKTGTTNEAKDVWFIGFTPDLVAGVYLGYDTPKSLGDASTGGHLAAPIVSEFFKLALADKAAVPFRIPPGIKLVRIDRRTGMRAPPGDPDSILEAFKPDTDPPDSYSQIGSSDGSNGDVWSNGGNGSLGSGTGGLY